MARITAPCAMLANRSLLAVQWRQPDARACLLDHPAHCGGRIVVRLTGSDSVCVPWIIKAAAVFRVIQGSYLKGHRAGG